VVVLACSLLIAAVPPVASGTTAAPTATGGTGSGTVPEAGHEPGPDAGLEAAGDPGSDANATPPGTWLYGIVGVQDANVRAATNDSAYEARLATADSSAATARIVDDRLETTDQRLDAAQRRQERLERERESGAMSPGEYRARAARLVAEVRGVERILERSERALADVPEEQRERRRLHDRIENQRARADAIVDEELARAAAAIDASDREGRPTDARPVDVDHLERAVGGTDVPGRFRSLFGNERTTVHVRRANGSVAKYHLRTRDGAVVDVARGPAEDPTVHVYTTHEVVREAATAENPWSVVDRGLSEDRITISGVGIGGTVKYWVASALYDLYDGVRGLADGVTDFLGG
jgi:hypothetical protein